MKDFENMSVAKMHDYKRFTIEPTIGGYNILLYGRKNVLYVGGPGGWHMVEDMLQARSFRSVDFCHGLIDEVYKDHAGWIETLGGKKVIDLTGHEMKALENTFDGKTKQAVKPEGISPEQIQDIKYHESL